MLGGRFGRPIGVVTALIAVGLMGPVARPADAVTSGPLLISAGGDVTCARVPDGTPRCFGNKKWGQLGNSHVPGTPLAVVVAGLSKVTAISAGLRTTCALLADRNVKCWGLVFASRHYGATPRPVRGFTNVLAVSVGGSFGCVVRVGGTVRCAGYNNTGQLGHGDVNKHETSVGVRGITNAVAVSAGAQHACALLADKTIKCWGLNVDGELGDGRISKPELAPVTVKGITGAIGVAAGDRHTCALMANRTVKCWGSNVSGQLGYGTVTNSSLPPVQVSGLIAVTAISAGSGYTCAVVVSREVMCWGSNLYGTLGNGTTADSSTPVAVHVTRAVGISAGTGHACVTLDDSARCWGNNGYGQLGSRHAKSSSVPIVVPDI